MRVWSTTIHFSGNMYEATFFSLSKIDNTISVLQMTSFVRCMNNFVLSVSHSKLNVFVGT